MCSKKTSLERKIQLHFGYTVNKVQTNALVDLGATTNFVDRVFVENNNNKTCLSLYRNWIS